MLDVLGLANLAEPLVDLQQPTPEDLELLERRTAARARRDFGEADRLRDELRARGWEVRDGPRGAELFPAE